MNEIEVKIPETDYSVTEAYKTLRANLQFCGADIKVIGITSCTSNEGKSTVTLNLAAALAETGKKVLLMDADLRKSVLAARVGLCQEVKGMTHYLSKLCDVMDVICATNIKRLHMAFAGPVPPNPAELLSGKRFHELLEASRKCYDYVLIDTPPLGNVIDGAVVAKECDGCILVIESGAVSYRFAQEVKMQLEKSNCPILGTVLNKVDTSSMKYYGKYGKYGQYGNYGLHGRNK